MQQPSLPSLICLTYKTIDFLDSKGDIGGYNLNPEVVMNWLAPLRGFKIDSALQMACININWAKKWETIFAHRFCSLSARLFYCLQSISVSQSFVFNDMFFTLPFDLQKG